MPLIVKQDNADRLMKSVRHLVRNDVLVGIPDSTAERQPEPGEKSRPASNALIGYVHETGDPARNIPERPFLVPGVQGAREAIAAQLRKGAEAALKMGPQDQAIAEIDRSLDATGLVAQTAVKTKLTEGPFQPLSERTLQARRARGRTGESPLIDTAQLLNSVTYVKRPKGG